MYKTEQHITQLSYIYDHIKMHFYNIGKECMKILKTHRQVHTE